MSWNSPIRPPRMRANRPDTLSATTSLDAEREAYRNLALVRLRALEVEVEQAINNASGSTIGDRFGYPERAKAGPSDFAKAAVGKIRDLINTYEQEAR